MHFREDNLENVAWLTKSQSCDLFVFWNNVHLIKIRRLPVFPNGTFSFETRYILSLSDK